MTPIEYLVESFDYYHKVNFREHLAERGAEGWILVNREVGGRDMIEWRDGYVFYRPVQL